MEEGIGLIGFGEAGRTLAVAGDWAARLRVYDIQTDSAELRQAKLSEYRAAGIDGRDSLSEALDRATVVLSMVTADEALAAACAAAPVIRAGALYCDFNSVAPQSKRNAATAIQAAGAHYVDVAMMAPVQPGNLGVPLLISGPQADLAASSLTALGFSNARVVGNGIGRASSIKMVRSVVVKGIEALTIEAMLAAEVAGVRDEVIASLDASETRAGWADRADYNLDRMMVHGLRRAAEMQEVVKTLEGLGVAAVMTGGTVRRQYEIGRLGLKGPCPGLAGKLERIGAELGRQA